MTHPSDGPSLVAIGGVEPHHEAEIVAAGAAGIAMMRAAFGARSGGER